MRRFEEFGQLLFPTRCFGCNEIGIPICANCRREWHPHFYSTHIAKLQVHSGVMYSPIASKIILAAKENGLVGADTLVIDSIIHVLSLARFNDHNIRLVPIPSSSSARRRRGRSFVVDITSKIGRQLGIPVSDSLELCRKVVDQSGLDATARAENMQGAFTLKRGAFPRGDLILIDDVVTTGATLTEAARVLRLQGLHVLASVTACVAQPLR
jgi:predicted amidophosphoribosyltransferase